MQCKTKFLIQLSPHFFCTINFLCLCKRKSLSTGNLRLPTFIKSIFGIRSSFKPATYGGSKIGIRAATDGGVQKTNDVCVSGQFWAMPKTEVESVSKSKAYFDTLSYKLEVQKLARTPVNLQYLHT